MLFEILVRGWQQCIFILHHCKLNYKKRALTVILQHPHLSACVRTNLQKCRVNRSTIDSRIVKEVYQEPVKLDIGSLVKYSQVS